MSRVSTPSTQMSRAGTPSTVSSPSQTQSPRGSTESWAFSAIHSLRRSRPDSRRSPLSSSETFVKTQQSDFRHDFDQLPTEVCDAILTCIINGYVDNTTVNVTCLLRDLSSCALISKRWYFAAREHMYGHIWLPRNEASKRKKRFALKHSRGRLELLARTFTEQPHLANLVYAMHVTPALHAELFTPKTLLSKSTGPADLLRAVIDLCPAVEQITGFIPELEPHFANYHQALLKRPQLKVLAWWTKPDNRFRVDIDRFAQFEQCWNGLTTLILDHGNPAQPMSAEQGSILALIVSLPSLQRLMLSGLSKEDVNNDVLLRLPPLYCLRLERLPGVTDEGIVAYASSGHARQLHSLTLSTLHLKQLETVMIVFKTCLRLFRFRLVQMYALDYIDPLGSTTHFAALSSPKLRYLHWETLVAGDTPRLIAESISLGGFPSLRTIKAPCDHEGIIQSVCRPIDETLISEDDAKFLERERLHQSPHSRRLSQLRAQQRMQDKRQELSLDSWQYDTPQHMDVIGSYLGRLDSKVEYSLEPDAPGAAETLCQMTDLIKAPMEHSEDHASALQEGHCQVLDYDLLF